MSLVARHARRALRRGVRPGWHLRARGEPVRQGRVLSCVRGVLGRGAGSRRPVLVRAWPDPWPSLLGTFAIAERSGHPSIVYTEDVADGGVNDEPATVKHD